MTGVNRMTGMIGITRMTGMNRMTWILDDYRSAGNHNTKTAEMH